MSPSHPERTVLVHSAGRGREVCHVAFHGKNLLPLLEVIVQKVAFNELAEHFPHRYLCDHYSKLCRMKQSVFIPNLILRLISDGSNDLVSIT